MKLRYGLTISILMHTAALILVLMLHPGGNSKGGGEGDKEGQPASGASPYDGVDVKGVLSKDKPVEVSIVEVIPPDKGDVEIKEEKTEEQKAQEARDLKANEDCPSHYYEGVGLEENMGTIVRVFPGYPADIAGLLPGDIITSTGGQQIIGPAGTSLMMTISRNGLPMMFHIIRGKVCY